MDCDEFVELVTAFLDGVLPESDEGRFVAHLTECGGCERYLEQFRQTVEALGGLGEAGGLASETSPTGNLPAETLPGDTRARLLAAFREKKQR